MVQRILNESCLLGISAFPLTVLFTFCFQVPDTEISLQDISLQQCCFSKKKSIFLYFQHECCQNYFISRTLHFPEAVDPRAASGQNYEASIKWSWLDVMICVSSMGCYELSKGKDCELLTLMCSMATKSSSCLFLL